MFSTAALLFYIVLMVGYGLGAFFGVLCRCDHEKSTPWMHDLIAFSAILLVLMVCVGLVHGSSAAPLSVNPVLGWPLTFLLGELFGFPAGWIAEWRRSSSPRRAERRAEKKAAKIDRRRQKQLSSVRAQRRLARQGLTRIHKAAGNGHLFAELLERANVLGNTDGRAPSYLSRLFRRVEELESSIKKEMRGLNIDGYPSMSRAAREQAHSLALMNQRLQDTWYLIHEIVLVLITTSDDVSVIRTAASSDLTQSLNQLYKLVEEYDCLIEDAANIVGKIGWAHSGTVQLTDEERAAQDEVERLVASLRSQDTR